MTLIYPKGPSISLVYTLGGELEISEPCWALSIYYIPKWILVLLGYRLIAGWGQYPINNDPGAEVCSLTLAKSSIHLQYWGLNKYQYCDSIFLVQVAV